MDFQIFIECIRPRDGYDRTAARLQFRGRDLDILRFDRAGFRFTVRSYDLILVTCHIRLLIQFLLHRSGILCILDGIGAIDPVL